MPDDTIAFFDQKRSWSKYKDLILDYYLQPYLAKVLHIGKPVLLVDCFAGPGKYSDGSEGSPLIIGRHVAPHAVSGASIECAFAESDPSLFRRLRENLQDIPFKATLLDGDFHTHISWITERAKTHTVFIYLDPIKPSQLLFEDMKPVYDQLRNNQSIEVLTNFLSPWFLRQALGALKCPTVPASQEETVCSQIAGGNYWQDICLDNTLSNSDRVEKLASQYACELGRWFHYCLYYPIRDKYEHKWPKYHLIFGTRHPDAVDLMNRAMVKARREFVGSRFIEGMLFDNRPAKEVIDLQEIRGHVLNTSRIIGRTSWRLLRVQTTIRHPGKFTDSEFNTAIKKAIADGHLGCSASGRKIEEDAEVWPIVPPDRPI